MIPINNIVSKNGIKLTKFTSNSYKLDDKKEHIKGNIDNIEAIKQAVYKILRTERYNYEIYDWNYGIELNDLIGKSKNFVKSEIIWRITDALIVDDRISEVFDFTFKDIDKTSILVSFKIRTDFGNENIMWEVSI